MKLSISKAVFAAGSLFFTGSLARAETAQPDLVTAPVEKAFVPMGFDGNDNVEVIVHGHFANTCYKVGPAKASVDYATSTVTVDATAYVYAGLMCAQVLVPFTESVSLGTVRPGTYRVVVKDRPTAETTDLVVVEATTDSPDDFLYAPVEEAGLRVRADGQQLVRIEGSYPYTFVGCMVVKELRIIRTPGNVVVVQPIAELLTGGPACDEQHGAKNFVIETPVREALEPGEYLMHVRALSGRSVNRVVALDAR